MVTNSVNQRALLSTADKTDLVDLAKVLIQSGFMLIATDGTAQWLKENGISVTHVTEYTGFPEIMGGRIKTLHPKLFGGLLRRDVDEVVMQQHHIHPIDLLVVNLYPFQKTIRNPKCSLAEAIEQIDIGGPAMLRAGAKNFQQVTTVVDPADYPSIIDELKTQKHTSLATRQKLAAKVFAHTAQYDTAIANYLAAATPVETPLDSPNILPATLTLDYKKQLDLRYGENPHQTAAFYHPNTARPLNAEQLQGKPLSYNNLVDSEAALHAVRSFNSTTPSCVIVKHATPCGVAQANTLVGAYQKAYATDSQSAFGGIIAVNQPLDQKTAEAITNQQFVEVILAPEVTEQAQAILARKVNLRVLAFGNDQPAHALNIRSLDSGLLVQQPDQLPITQANLETVTKRKPTASEINDLLFAWHVVKFVKSNAIVYAKDTATLAIGTGQTSRVFSAEIAILKAQQAGLSLNGAVMASDAFFPFADSVEIAAKAGIMAIIQPGGSKRDPEVIAAADNAEMTMVMTGTRHFLH